MSNKIELIVTETGSSTPDEWINREKMFYLRRNYEEMVTEYDKALKIDTRYALPWHKKGNALIKQEKYEEAVECYDKALEINPQYASSWNNKGYALAQKEKYGEAIKCYDKALEIQPENIDILSNRAEASGKQEKKKEALENYNTAIKYCWLKKGELLLESGNYEEAVKCCDRALEIDPFYMQARNNRNKALSEMEKIS